MHAQHDVLLAQNHRPTIAYFDTVHMRVNVTSQNDGTYHGLGNGSFSSATL